MDAALESYRQALHLFRAVGDRLGEANTIYAMGEVARKAGAYAQAQQHYQWALGTYEAIGDRLGQANVLDSLGELAEAQEAWAEAAEWFARALARYEAIGASYARVTRQNLERVQAQVRALLAGEPSP